MWSGGGQTRGKVSPGWFHKCRTKCWRAITPPSNSTCENKHWCENLEKATRGEIEMCQSHLATGPPIESTEESFLHKASKMPLRSHRRQMVYQSSFILGEICEQYCAIAKENVSHIFCFWFSGSKQNRKKKKKKKEQKDVTLNLQLCRWTWPFWRPALTVLRSRVSSGWPGPIVNTDTHSVTPPCVFFLFLDPGLSPVVSRRAAVYPPLRLTPAQLLRLHSSPDSDIKHRLRFGFLCGITVITGLQEAGHGHRTQLQQPGRRSATQLCWNHKQLLLRSCLAEWKRW